MAALRSSRSVASSVGVAVFDACGGVIAGSMVDSADEPIVPLMMLAALSMIVSPRRLFHELWALRSATTPVDGPTASAKAARRAVENSLPDESNDSSNERVEIGLCGGEDGN